MIIARFSAQPPTEPAHQKIVFDLQLAYLLVKFAGQRLVLLPACPPPFSKTDAIPSTAARFHCVTWFGCKLVVKIKRMVPGVVMPLDQREFRVNKDFRASKFPLI